MTNVARARTGYALVVFGVITCMANLTHAQSLADLARPQEGRSMRSTSTQRTPEGGYAHGNGDNSRVAPGETKTVLDVQGPGVVTHMWFTFLAPEPHAWAKTGSADHQEILLRVYYDGADQPGRRGSLRRLLRKLFWQTR